MKEFSLKLYGEDESRKIFDLSPLHGNRHEISKIIDEIGLTGDIFLRLGNEKYLGISFSHLVARATKSEFSHAAIGIKQYGHMWAIEQNGFGCSLQRIVDHIDLALSGRLFIVRLKDINEDIIARLDKSITKYLDQDPDYNFNFQPDTGKYYCTQAVAHMYEDAGITLVKPEMPGKLMDNLAKFLVPPINSIFKLASKGQRCLPMDIPVYIVGNKEHGILSSPLLRPIADFREVGKDTTYDRFLTNRLI